MVGDCRADALGKYGYAWVSFLVNEGGQQGEVDYYAQVPLYSADGTAYTPSELNQAARANIAEQRASQGNTGPLNPPLESFAFFS